MISVAEAAALLGRSLEYLYAGIREHRFPGIRFGRGVALPRAFIENFIKDATIGRGQVSFEDYAADWKAGKTVASEEVA